MPLRVRASINLQGRKAPYFLHDPDVLAKAFLQSPAEGTASWPCTRALAIDAPPFGGGSQHQEGM